MCFIKKKFPKDNKLGKRVVVGRSAIVVPDRKRLNNQDSQNLNQSNNPWSNKDLLPEEELVLCQKKLEKVKKQVLDLEKVIQNIKNK